MTNQEHQNLSHWNTTKRRIGKEVEGAITIKKIRHQRPTNLLLGFAAAI
jgi:hypothetical protein